MSTRDVFPSCIIDTSEAMSCQSRLAHAAEDSAILTRMLQSGQPIAGLEILDQAIDWQYEKYQLSEPQGLTCSFVRQIHYLGPEAH